MTTVSGCADNVSAKGSGKPEMPENYYLKNSLEEKYMKKLIGGLLAVSMVLASAMAMAADVKTASTPNIPVNYAIEKSCWINVYPSYDLPAGSHWLDFVGATSFTTNGSFDLLLKGEDLDTKNETATSADVVMTQFGTNFDGYVGAKLLWNSGAPTQGIWTLQLDGLSPIHTPLSAGAIQGTNTFSWAGTVAKGIHDMGVGLKVAGVELDEKAGNYSGNVVVTVSADPISY